MLHMLSETGLGVALAIVIALAAICAAVRKPRTNNPKENKNVQM